MRIIGGIYKNKKISLPTDKFTRPLKDMVRESIFNIIEHSNLIKKKILNSSKYLNYLIVIIISFIGLIIILDTFKYPLKVVFPQSENMLQNLYETLKDIFLFLIDFNICE